MDDLKTLFERQARWQLSRAKLSWTEKLRMAEILREAALAMGSSQRKPEIPAGSEIKGFKED
jgi:AAA+ ATPase superfamily predicted ATPase